MKFCNYLNYYDSVDGFVDSIFIGTTPHCDFNNWNNFTLQF